MPVPLGLHSGPSPIPGVQDTQITGRLGAAARSIIVGQEGLGRLITSLPLP